MPNWCENVVRIIAPTEAAAVAFECEFIEANLMNSFLPVEVDDTPAQMGLMTFPKWYVDRSQSWGVKWEIDPADGYVCRVGCELDCYLMTAWTVPFAFFEHLVSLGYKVELTYFEPGMMFGGRWSATEDIRWNYESSEALTRESIPAYLYEAFGDDAFDWIWDERDEEE